MLQTLNTGIDRPVPIYKNRPVPIQSTVDRMWFRISTKICFYQAMSVGRKQIAKQTYKHQLLAHILACSANLLEGLYIVPMFFFSLFLNIFNDRLSRPSSSESNGPIFTKISGLVDGCQGLFTSFSFLRSLKVHCHGNQLK